MAHTGTQECLRYKLVRQNQNCWSWTYRALQRSNAGNDVRSFTLRKRAAGIGLRQATVGPAFSARTRPGRRLVSQMAGIGTI